MSAGGTICHGMADDLPILSFPFSTLDHKSPSAGKFLVSYNIPSRSFPVTKSRNGQLITPRLFLPHLPCHTALNAKPFLPPTLSKIESEASSVHRSVATSSKPSFPPSCQISVHCCHILVLSSVYPRKSP
ncbi:hypothetical protein EYC84_006921 [Monilinia fructicola]|uniref:Uncharacterized protein n=1 Tax=Monilinia fructicola TaxID=38448 RepID=A0A5M9K5H4_MONFR|nr:hypothetical protein EYC84_006921 [Monilinia fructicola]